MQSQLPARAAQGVLDQDARRLQAVADRVGRGVVLAVARRLALLQRDLDQRVDHRRAGPSSAAGPDQCSSERVQPEHRHHPADRGGLLGRSGRIAGGERGVALGHSLVHHGQGLRHAEVVVQRRGERGGQRRGARLRPVWLRRRARFGGPGRRSPRSAGTPAAASARASGEYSISER